MAEECAICFETNDSFELECKHKICKGCIKQFNCFTCPYCRRIMIANRNVNKVMNNIINKVLQDEENEIKCNQIIQTIMELYECFNRGEITIPELTQNILTSMMNISNIERVKQIIHTETYMSIIDENY